MGVAKSIERLFNNTNIYLIMKKLVLITAILFSINLQSQSFNKIEDDKIQHFVFGGLAGTPGYFLGWDASGGNRTTAIWSGIGLGFGFNLIKEGTDINKTGFSFDDLAWGTFGAVTSTLITDLIFQSKGSKKRREAYRIEKEKKRLDEIYKL